MKNKNIVKDILIESAKFRINKYDSATGKFLDSSEIDGNTLLNEGINELTKLIGSDSGSEWSNANAYLGVGDSGAAASASQTGLLGTSVYKGMESGYPTYGSSQKITWKSSFASDEANQDWKEFTVGNDSTDAAAVNLNRATSDEGTKTAGQTWELELEITFS